MRVEPQAREALLERALLPVLGRGPWTFARRLREPADHHRHRAAAVADPHVEPGMTIEHAAEDQRGDRDGFLRAEADDDVQVEALEAGIAGRAVDTRRRG